MPIYRSTTKTAIQGHRPISYRPVDVAVAFTSALAVLWPRYRLISIIKTLVLLNRGCAVTQHPSKNAIDRLATVCRFDSFMEFFEYYDITVLCIIIIKHERKTVILFVI